MSARTDQVNINININGNNAQNQLNELKKRAGDIAASMVGLKKNTQEWIDKTAELGKVNTNIAELKKQIGLTSLSLKELYAEQKKLNALYASAIPGTQQYKDFKAQLDAVGSRIYNVKNNVSGLGAVFSKVKDEVKQLGVLMIGYLGFQFVTEQFKNIIRSAGKLSDQLADLRRVTGLTADEAKNLNSALGKIDTRTSTGGLREIAVVAGKLGVAKDDILDFTKAVDMLTVALGDELGDADQITTTLGKILNVFDGKVTGDNITKLGNAFVELANAGVATGGFIADFDQRLSGIAKSAGIGLGALSGLGAGLEELGSRVESSATAVQKLIISIAADIPAAAKVAGMAVGEFDKLFNLDPTEALLRYSEGLVKNKDSFAQVTASLKDAGEEGARTVETISKLGTNAELLRQKIDLGTESMKESSAITEAFALKNETLGAELDKLGKEFYKLIFGSGATDWMKSVVTGAIDLVRWFKALPQFINENRITISLLVTAFIAVNKQMIISNLLWIQSKAAIILETAAKGAAALATLAYRAALYAMALAQAVVTGNIFKAQRAFILLNAAFKASPVGALVAALIGLGIALDAIFSKTSRLAKAQEELNKKAIDSYGDQVNLIEGKLRALNTENLGYETKKKILNELIALNPAFAETLKLDAEGHLTGANAVNEYVKALKRKGIAEAAQELSNEKNREILQLEEKLNKERVASGGKETEVYKFRTKAIVEQISKLKELQKFYDDKVTGSVVPTVEFVDPEAPKKKSTPTTPADAAKKSADAKKDEYASLRKEAEKFYADLLKLKQNAQNLDKTADERELLALQDKYNELHAKALEFFKKNVIDRKKYTAEEKLIIESFNLELANLQKKQFERNSEDEYKKALDNTREYFDQQQTETGKAYAAGEIDKQTYSDTLKALDQQEKEQLIVVAEQYIATTKSAEKDLLKFKVDADKSATENAIKNAELRTEIAKQEAVAKAKLAVLSSPEGSADRKNAQKKLAQVLFDQDTKDLDKRSELYKEKAAELNDTLKKIDDDFINAEIEKWQAIGQQLVTTVGDLLTILDNLDLKAFNKEKARNEAKKNSYKKQLDDKLLSQKQYDAKVAKADEDLAKKKHELDLKNFKRQQALNVASVFIDTAAAIAKTFVKYGWPAGIPFAAGMAIVGGLQVGAILSQQPPEMGTGGLIKNGPYHSDKSRGLPLINPETGLTEMLLEKDEGVLMGDAMRDSNNYTVSGTPSQIASRLNALHGGVNWESGAVIQMPKFRERPAQISASMPGIMAAGGNFSQNSISSVVNSEISDSLLRQLIAAVEAKNDRLHAVISIKEFRDEAKKYDNAKKASGMNQ